MLVVIDFFRPDLSPSGYRNRCFSGCTVPPDSKENELGCSNQEAPLSTGKISVSLLYYFAHERGFLQLFLVVQIFLRSMSVICFNT